MAQRKTDKDNSETTFCFNSEKKSHFLLLSVVKSGVISDGSSPIKVVGFVVADNFLVPMTADQSESCKYQFNKFWTTELTKKTVPFINT